MVDPFFTFLEIYKIKKQINGQRRKILYKHRGK